MVLLVALAGCGTSAQTPATPAQSATTLATVTPTSSPTVAATASPTQSAPTTTTFTCATTVSGSLKTFTDSQTHFSFSYPAAWTENQCQRIVAADGTERIFIGNLFSVGVMPRSGQTIQQWVSAQTDQYEVVTLGTLSVPQAQAAVSVSTQPAATPNPNKPFDAEPFAQTMAIIAGSQHFYVINYFIAQMSMSDTLPGLSPQQLNQQVVTTFVVP
jgi:hypothetical protein